MKPIIFSTGMVHAILGGRKTMTRRVIKPQPPGAEYPEMRVWFRTVKIPYDPDQILWVREAWLEEDGRYFYRADYEDGLVDPCETLSGGYPSECRHYPECVGCQRTSWRPPWRPSIHMPREAARLFLRVLSVRVRRLQEITEEDAIAEGFTPEPLGACDKECLHCDSYFYHSQGCGKGTITMDSPCHADARDSFADFWDRIYAKRGYPYTSNPWVWVVEFERAEVPK